MFHNKKIKVFIAIIILFLAMGINSSYKKPKTHIKFISPKSKALAKHNDVFFSLKTIITNLKSTSGTQHFIEVSIDLQLKDKKHIAIINSKLPVITNAIELYLRGFSYSDLQADDIIDKLKLGLIYQIDEVINPYRIEDLLFQNFLVQ